MEPSYYSIIREMVKINVKASDLMSPLVVELKKDFPTLEELKSKQKEIKTIIEDTLPDESKEIMRITEVYLHSQTKDAYQLDMMEKRESIKKE